MDEFGELFTVTAWQHQLQGVKDVTDAIIGGERRICLTSPTGGGKTEMIMALVRWAKLRGWNVSLYWNRNLLLDQMIGKLDAWGEQFGVRSARFRRSRTVEDLQVCSMPTVISRAKHTRLHQANLVIVDEAHLMRTGKSRKILNDHIHDGSYLVGVTATPVGLSSMYNLLVEAGSNSALRRCGALVPAYVYAPLEVDVTGIARNQDGEFNQVQMDRRMRAVRATLVGNVEFWWRKYNPEGRATLAFASGVAESIWFATHFSQRGIPCAHIDGDNVWVDGNLYTGSNEMRQRILDSWKKGQIKIVWNRFVMREGLDFPWLYHVILACPIGSIVSYIQTVGRVLRKSPETPHHVILSDHGGNYWRHCSPNENYCWPEMFHSSIAAASATRQRQIAMKERPEPYQCQCCGVIRDGNSWGKPCPLCQAITHHRTRHVLQTNGMIVPVHGQAIHIRRIKETSRTQQQWDQLYWPSRNSTSPRSSTFLQLEARFYCKWGYWPPRTLNNQPLFQVDWFRQVSRVERNRVRRPEDQDQTNRPPPRQKTLAFVDVAGDGRKKGPAKNAALPKGDAKKT